MNGIKRRSSPFNINRLDHLYQDPHVDHQRFKLHYGDPGDASDLIRIVLEVKVEVEVEPNEIYNLGALSHVPVRFEMPEQAADADGIGTLRLLDTIRMLGLAKKTCLYQASTSELDGLLQEIPQGETTPF